MAKMFLIFVALAIGLAGLYFFRLPKAQFAENRSDKKNSSPSAQFNPPPFKTEIKNVR